MKQLSVFGVEPVFIKPFLLTLFGVPLGFLNCYPENTSFEEIAVIYSKDGVFLAERSLTSMRFNKLLEDDRRNKLGIVTFYGIKGGDFKDQEEFNEDSIAHRDVADFFS